MTKDEKAYESDIHRMILENESIFGELGKTTVILEKKLHDRHVIADILIFSEIRGIIGIEIKTAHDTTQRLNKQLNAYKEIANEVWVVIADEQYEKVSKVLKDNHHEAVGIISYGQIGDKLFPGIMKYPSIPTQFDYRNIYRVMWKSELVAMANGLSAGGEILVNIYTELAPLEGQTNYSAGKHGQKRFNKRSLGPQPTVVTQRMTKDQIIDYIFTRLGSINAYKLIISMFIEGTKHPDKVLKSYHFKQREIDSNERIYR